MYKLLCRPVMIINNVLIVRCIIRNTVSLPAWIISICMFVSLPLSTKETRH